MVVQPDPPKSGGKGDGTDAGGASAGAEAAPRRRVRLVKPGETADDLHAEAAREWLRSEDGRRATTPRRWPVIVGLGIAAAVSALIWGGLALLASQGGR